MINTTSTAARIIDRAGRIGIVTGHFKHPSVRFSDGTVTPERDGLYARPEGIAALVNTTLITDTTWVKGDDGNYRGVWFDGGGFVSAKIINT